MTAPKLLFYTHGLVDGGAERLWSCLASAFHARGYDVIFAQDFEATDNRHNVDPSIPVFTLGPNHVGSVRALAQLLKRENPDVALSAVGGSNLKLVLASRLAGVKTKVIISYHGYEEWKSGVLSFLTFCGLPFLSVMSDRTIAVSVGLARDLKSMWGADPGRTRAIHNPVHFPPDAPLPAAQELAAREDVILAVGRLTAIKDFVTLIRAFKLLDRPAAKLIILGKGPEQARLEGLIAELGLGDRVRLAGYATEPWATYRSAKCLALSSRNEQFGNVLVEAMAFGLPVVATDCNGPREILDQGRYGELVPIQNPEALAQALERALASPGDPMARRARAETFSFTSRVPAYEHLIREVLGVAETQPSVKSQPMPQAADHRGAEGLDKRMVRLP